MGKTAPFPVNVKMVPAVIPSVGAVAARLASVETCARMVSPCFSQPQKMPLFLNLHWKDFFFSSLPKTRAHYPRIYQKLTVSFPPCTGCPKGFYGKLCNKKCNCANNGRCHRTYGACLCDPGLYGRFCHLREPHISH